MNQIYPSILLEDAVREFSRLPGIGKKTALRLVLHLLRQPEEQAVALGNAMIRLRQEVCHCSHCHNISDSDTCPICSDQRRDHQLVCVVENVREVMAVEGTNQFQGVYHVLGGLISPMDGVGPSDLEIESLVERVRVGEVREVLMALSATMEGDTTAFYLYRKLAAFPVKITTIARGIAVGDELDYADEITLGRSIVNRIDFKG
jgi:recombination protein RecR